MGNRHPAHLMSFCLILLEDSTLLVCSALVQSHHLGSTLFYLVGTDWQHRDQSRAGERGEAEEARSMKMNILHCSSLQSQSI